PQRIADGTGGDLRARFALRGFQVRSRWARRDKAAVRERLEASVSGLGELELLRRRQEVLVRAALELREPREEEERQRREAQLSSEEKLLEGNILLLRKQLNCLRRRDAGLIAQLQELDRQISDLRLDTGTSHEPDSRPSSGFYDLSDAVSGSLSNSSNSVFSECFCSTLASCLECDVLVGGLCDESSSSGTVRRSLSAPNPPTVDAASSFLSTEPQSKYHCDLVARNGNDVYRYPSPLHAVVVQSPAFLQMLGFGGPGRDEADTSALPPSVSAPHVSQSYSWPASSSQTPSHKRLDSYIYSLLQRKAQPIRTSKPRTSISTDPSKSILRQASLCVRQVSGPGSGFGTLSASEFKALWTARGTSAEGAGTSSPQRQWSVDGKLEEQETQSVLKDGGFEATSTNSLRKKSKADLPHATLSAKTLPKNFRDLGSPKANPAPNEVKPPCCPPDQEMFLKSAPVMKTQSSTPRNSPGTGRSALELTSVGSSSQSQDEAAAEGGSCHTVTNRYVPAHQHRLRKGGFKNVKVRSSLMKTSHVSEHNGGSAHVKVSKRFASSRIKRLPASIPEGRVLDRQPPSALHGARPSISKHHHHGNHHCCSGNHHHHHGRNQVVVVAKPKYKRNDYRRLRAMMEVPYDEAFRRAQRRQRKELLNSSVYPPAGARLTSPYSYTAGSDSEYSAECASLFHSTIVDTSEDERSNYTTNCFGDSESSEEECVEESTNTSDTEESGGGGMGRGRGQLGGAGVRATGQEIMSAQAKAFVKIKASHNLKKKILRFRSGSLKLMTTV
uniref:Dishevelled binding antagonist of beta catenin 1 n=1 Tax=Astatotilapia calliptera TaxID=8154 RepID=A0AAX7VS67_ASTCA